MNDFERMLFDVSEAFTIENTFSYSVRGKRHVVNIPKPVCQQNIAPEQFGSSLFESGQLREEMRNRIANHIYSEFYCTGKTTGENREPETCPTQEEREAFMQQLSLKNTSRDGYDLCWIVQHIDPAGHVFVHKNGQIRQLFQNEWASLLATDQNLQLGQMIHLKVNRESRTLQEAFYYAMGKELMPQHTDLIRFYFNVNPLHISHLLEAITQKFNYYSVPFCFKCLNHAALYQRADSAVLYIPASLYKVSWWLLRKILTSLNKDCLRQEVPLFTNKLFPGLSFAEDSGTGQSFGMERSKLLAEAIIRIHEKILDTANGRSEEITAVFAEKGICCKTIYRKPQFKYVSSTTP